MSKLKSKDKTRGRMRRAHATRRGTGTDEARPGGTDAREGRSEGAGDERTAEMLFGGPHPHE